jgi:hypothetical protein
MNAGELRTRVAGTVIARGEHDRAARSFSRATWERLAKLRRRWDADGVFHAFLTP